MELDSDGRKQDIKIVRLAEGDASAVTDNLCNFKSMLLSCESMYPGIDKWVKNKVFPGIRSGERAAFIGYLNETPVVSAVVKKGDDAKICHLNVLPELQSTNLGEVFFTLMAIELRSIASNVHFTLPESLWHTKHEFFEAFGFDKISEHDLQYRSFDPELRSETTFKALWQRVLEKMPKLAHIYSLGGFSLDSQLLLSVSPKYSAKILSGEKTVEVRRSFSRRWNGARVSIYETHPTMGLVGEALIKSIHAGRPEGLWQRFGQKMGCTYEEYAAYCSGATEVFAVELTDVHPYRSPVSLMWASGLLGTPLHPPQSYLTLEKGRPWAQAVTLATYMHGCFQGYSGRLDRRSPRVTPVFRERPVQDTQLDLFK